MLFSIGIHRMFSNRNYSNKQKDNINCTEQWHFWWSDQIATSVEWGTRRLYNAANRSAVWKHSKLSEKDRKIITSTDSERLSSNIFDEKRKRWLLLVTVWLKLWNGLNQLVNKLQNVMFSNTCTNCMYSDSSSSSLQDLSEIILICWFAAQLSFFFVFSQSHAWF